MFQDMVTLIIRNHHHHHHHHVLLSEAQLQICLHPSLSYHDFLLFNSSQSYPLSCKFFFTWIIHLSCGLHHGCFPCTLIFNILFGTVIFPFIILFRCVCTNANPLHYYVLRVPRKADWWRWVWSIFNLRTAWDEYLYSVLKEVEVRMTVRPGADKSAFAKTCFLLLKIRHGAHQSSKI